MLHGLELGALLANKAFAADVGDALLLWAPPGNANDVLRAALLKRIAVDNMFRYGAERKRLARLPPTAGSRTSRGGWISMVQQALARRVPP